MSQSTQRFDEELVRLFDLSPDLFCVAGFDGSFKLLNRAWERTLGYTREELLAKHSLDITHPDDVEAAREALSQLALGKELAAFEARVICADGSVRWLEWNTSARPEEGFVYGVARDVTDRRVANDELSSLRRVATLVAEGAQPEYVFAVVAEEVARVCDIQATSVVRYEPDGTATECANFLMGSVRGLFPVGVRMNIEGANILRFVRDRGAAARIDDYSKAHGEMAEVVRSAGVRSTVGVPIVVAGRLWGTMVGSTTGPVPLPEDTPARLADFTKLLATAIANTESREALQQLADEQAALRRVATLVALGGRPVEIFSAVSEEVGRLFGFGVAAVVRFEPDGPALVVVGVAKSVEEAVPIGTRWELEDAPAAAKVLHTGRPARVDRRLESERGPVGDAERRLGAFSTVASPIVVEGRLWGTVSVSHTQALPLDTEKRLEKFTELVATAIANAESRTELAASRRRIVAASDETRHRIERDLHDGTQQRLVSLGLAVRAAEANVPAERNDLRDELTQIATGLADAMKDLQEISRGIHPAILSQGGLAPALRTLARRSAIPVELDVTMDKRLPEPIELAAYFVASEALANATKHAHASHVEVALGTQDGNLLLSIRDDGVGGAALGRGSGLIGLTDRLEALGGSIRLRSTAGNGTEIRAALPLELEVPSRRS